MVIDREFIAEQIWGQTMQPAYSFMPPGIGNYGKPAWRPTTRRCRRSTARKRRRRCSRRPDSARGKPLKVEIRYNTTDNNRNTVIAVADQWKQLGVETSFINTDGKTHFAYLRDGGDFDVARYGWIGDYSDPQNFLFLLKSDNKGFNYGKCKNPEFDDLMKNKAAKETRSRQARRRSCSRPRRSSWRTALDPDHVLRQENLISPKHSRASMQNISRRLPDALPG